MRLASDIAPQLAGWLGAALVLLGSGPARAQEPADEPPPPKDYGGEPEGPPSTPPGYGEQPPAEPGPPPPPPPPRGQGGQYPRVGEPAPGPEHSQPDEVDPAQRPGHHEHDGFYLRLSVGPGYTRTDADEGSFSLHSGGIVLSFAIGGVVGDNFVLAGDLFGTVSAGSALGETVLLSTSGLGPTLIRYIMPANVYFSVSAGIGVATLESASRVAQTDVGFATNVRVGKEFWVGSDWALGVGGQFMYFLLKDAFSTTRALRNERLNVYSVGATFNVTFN